MIKIITIKLNPTTKKMKLKKIMSDMIKSIFMTVIDKNHINLIHILKKYSIKTAVNYILNYALQKNNPGAFKILTTKKYRNMHKIKIRDTAIEFGALDILEIIFPYYKELEEKEKQQMRKNCVFKHFINLPKQKNFQKSMELLNKNPSLSVTTEDADGNSIRKILFNHFRKSLRMDDYKMLVNISKIFPDLYREFSNTTDSDGHSMIIAILHSEYDLVDFLLNSNNIDLEIRDEKNNTLLLIASQREEETTCSVISKLLEKGAKKDVINKDGMTINDFMLEHLIFLLNDNNMASACELLRHSKKHDIYIDSNNPSKISGKKLEDVMINYYLRCSSTRPIKNISHYFPDVYEKFLTHKDEFEYFYKFIAKKTSPPMIHFDRYKDMASYINRNDNITRLNALQKIYSLDSSQYPIALQAFSKLDRLVKQLNTLPDTKSTKIKEITKNIYSQFCKKINNPMLVFNQLSHEVFKLNYKFKTYLFYPTTPQFHNHHKNKEIVEKLKPIIKTFGTR
jgi:hypothetical protein